MTSSRLNAKAREYMKSHPGVNYTEALSRVSAPDMPMLGGVMSDMLNKLTGGGTPTPDLDTAMRTLGFEFPPNPDTAAAISVPDVRQGDVAKVGDRYGLVLEGSTCLLDGKIIPLSDCDDVEFFRLPAPPTDSTVDAAKAVAAEMLGAPPHAVWEETTVPLYAVQRGDVVQFNTHAGVYLGKGDVSVGGDTVKLSEAGTAVAVLRLRFAAAPFIPEGVSLYSLTEGDLAERWRRNEFTNDLHVPIGYDVEDNRVFGINIAETRAGGTGPHGIIQGSTGAGKSVLVTNIMLALAADHSPTKVTFALAESRGAFAAKRVEALPHLVKAWGRLEDDYEAQADFKDFIVQELGRREELLYEMGTHDISAYTAARAKDSTLPALPRLIVITEDASSTARVGKSLVSVVAKGRSLGVHLLMTEQHVTSSTLHEVRNYMSYGITFRCASASSSRAILNGVPDGANLPLGRGDALVRYIDGHWEEHIERCRTLRNGEGYASARASLMARIAEAASAQD